MTVLRQASTEMVVPEGARLGASVTFVAFERKYKDDTLVGSGSTEGAAVILGDTVGYAVLNQVG